MTNEAPANVLPGIETITSEQFRTALHIRLYPLVEDFVVTRIGRIDYAVSMEYGYAYTRPQLIEKYVNVGATFLITKREDR